jgi:hypothetical protein
MELRSMDFYIQILCKFQESRRKVPPPSLSCSKKSPFTPPKEDFSYPCMIGWVTIDYWSNLFSKRYIKKMIIFFSRYIHFYNEIKLILNTAGRNSLIQLTLELEFLITFKTLHFLGEG